MNRGKPLSPGKSVLFRRAAVRFDNLPGHCCVRECLPTESLARFRVVDYLTLAIGANKEWLNPWCLEHFPVAPQRLSHISARRSPQLEPGG